jgi:PadR family transcriptional regulator PadR
MQPLDKYETKLLDGWNEVYKKGQLTLWVLLALKDGEKYMAEIKAFIAKHASKPIAADDQSMYRALRRYHAAMLISFTTAPGDSGPERKVYCLTPTGSRVLAAFTEQNIVNVFYDESIKALITRKEEQ